MTEFALLCATVAYRMDGKRTFVTFFDQQEI